MSEASERQPLIQRHGGNDGSRDLSGAADGETPTGPKWTSEYSLVMKYSVPLIGTYLLQYLFQMVIVLVASRLSTEELAGVSLGITTSNIIGYAVFEGMATALDTLCSQAYGAGQTSMVGMHCIRFTIFIHIVALPIAAIWLLSPQILHYILPSDQLAAEAGTFLRISTIGIPGYAMFEAGKRFMQAQGNFNAGLAVLIMCLPVSTLFNYLFVFHFGWRVAGAALAAALVNAVRPLLLAGYVLIFDKEAMRCWPSSLDKQTLSGWGPMIRLSIPGALMTLSEWMSFEILTFATSFVSTTQLAAQTFLSVTIILVWHIPFSTSVAASTRIGHLIGGGLIDSARRVAAWYAWLFLAIGVLNVGLAVGIIALIVRYLAMDDDVRNIVAGTTASVAMFCFFDSTSSWVHGIVRGLGWQSIGGWVSMSVNYLYGVPLALGLLLGPANMGVNAIYLALGSGLGLMTVIEAVVVRLRSWDSIKAPAREEQV